MTKKLLFSNNLEEKLDYSPAFFPQISKREAPYKSFTALPNEKASIKILEEFLDSEILLSISIPRDLTLEAAFSVNPENNLG